MCIRDRPIFPMDWQYEVSAGTRKQFGILKKLMAREDAVSYTHLDVYKRQDHRLAERNARFSYYGKSVGDV